jgi:hypothetical protein
MDDNGSKAWTSTLERVEEAHRELEDDFPDKAIDNEDDEDHSAHSSSQSSSETILQEVREFTNLSDRVLQAGATGHEPIVASPTDDEANEILRTDRALSSASSGIGVDPVEGAPVEVAKDTTMPVQKPDEDDPWGSLVFNTPKRVPPASPGVEVAESLGPEDSRSLSSGTASASRRRMWDQRPGRNTRSLSGDHDVGARPQPQATHNIGRAGYYSSSALTPYFSQFQDPATLPNYWPYGSAPPPHPDLLRDPRLPGYYGTPQESDASRQKANFPAANSSPSNKDGSPQSSSSVAGWSLVSSPITTASMIQSSLPDRHAVQSRALEVTTTHQPALQERLVEGPEILSLQSDGLVFSVSVQCSHATLHSRFSTLLHQYWPERTAQNDSGNVCVRKAVSSKRFKQRDGLHSVELACQTGPASTDTEDYQIQWLYVNCIQTLLFEEY